jgi:uncharacterized protein (DUF2384 family)
MLNSLLDEVAEPRRGFISPRRLSDTLRMSMAELARVSRLHRNTLAQKPDSARAQARLGEIARILALATELIGDPGRAVVWFRHQPLAGFDNKTAEQLVEAGHGDAVLQHLETLSDGVYA